MIAAQAIADAFALGRARSFAHVADGMMARIWRLDTASGSYAVKDFDNVPDRYELQAQLRISAQLADAAAQAGVDAPRSVRSPTGELLLHLRDADGAVDVSVAGWIDGRRCQVRRDAASAATWLGETVAILELVPDPPNAPVLDPWLARLFTEAPTEAQWHATLDRAHRTGRPWADLLESRIARLVDLAAIVDRPAADHVTLLHTDLQAKNVLVTPTGFALLDWDDAALCSRDRILARTIVDWLTPGGIDTEAIVRFMRAYRSCGGSGAIRDLGDFGYAAAAFLNHAYETTTGDLADGSDDAASLVTAVLTDPLDVPTLERVLDTVRALP